MSVVQFSTAVLSGTDQQCLTFMVGGQMCGVPVLQVSDVLKTPHITPTPLSAPAVSGVMNLRGRVVTAISLHRCLGRDSETPGASAMSIVVEEHGEMISLLVESVGDVLEVDLHRREPVPVTLDDAWRGMVTSVYKLDGHLLVILDVRLLLERARAPHLERAT